MFKDTQLFQKRVLEGKGIYSLTETERKKYGEIDLTYCFRLRINYVKRSIILMLIGISCLLIFPDLLGFFLFIFLFGAFASNFVSFLSLLDIPKYLSKLNETHLEAEKIILEAK